MTNPSAFPGTATDIERDELSGNKYPNTYSYGGMTLLDYFAAKAMQGILASYSEEGARFPNDATLATWAYGIAEAMLAEREKRLKQL